MSYGDGAGHNVAHTDPLYTCVWTMIIDSAVAESSAPYAITRTQSGVSGRSAQNGSQVHHPRANQLLAAGQQGIQVPDLFSRPRSAKGASACRPLTTLFLHTKTLR